VSDDGLTGFFERHYRHFNARTMAAAAAAYAAHLAGGGRMLITLAGAMSTAELGISLAEMIRRGKVHAICCTGANLEEDIFNLVAHEHYEFLPEWRHLTPAGERALAERGLNRVTDTCIPEDAAFRVVEQPLLELWRAAEADGERLFPHEFIYRLLRNGCLEGRFQIDPRDSWVVAACEKGLPVFVPGWEDSTLGNTFVAHVLAGDLTGYGCVRSGLEYMGDLASWYAHTTMGCALDELPVSDGGDGVVATPGSEAVTSVGFFQIGGGIAGDFAICVVPMIQQDLRRSCPFWGYFCQISDSTTSYGSYSGATPSEKISWGKLDVDTPMFVVESDASIVAPLLFGWVLEQDGK
jgi:deoxyhypusine synthase